MVRPAQFSRRQEVDLRPQIAKRAYELYERQRPPERPNRSRLAPRGTGNKDGGETMTEQHMKTPIEYTIVAVPFHADAATHDELARKVNEKLGGGYELCGPPFLSQDMMYQAMTKPIFQASPLHIE